MPAPKKKPASNKNKPSEPKKPTQSSKQQQPQPNSVEKSSNRINTSTPDTTLPNTQQSSALNSEESLKSNYSSPDQRTLPAKNPLPMSVKPQHLPSKVHLPLVKTTYNTYWIKPFIMTSGALIVVSLIGIAWFYRGAFMPNNSNNQQQSETYQLSIPPTPTPDKQRLETASLNMSDFPDSSTSASTEDPQPPSSDQLHQALKDREMAELETYLEQSIEQLENLGVDTINLKAYQQKIDTHIEAGDIDTAKVLAIEAITHARELEYVHRYHQQ